MGKGKQSKNTKTAAAIAKKKQGEFKPKLEQKEAVEILNDSLFDRINGADQGKQEKSLLALAAISLNKSMPLQYFYNDDLVKRLYLLAN